jgi:putative transposase
VVWETPVLTFERSSMRWPGTQKECHTLKGHLLSGRVHRCFAIPPKHDPVASALGFLKENSATAIARLCGKERNFRGEHFWARDVGFEFEKIRRCTREQEQADGSGGPLTQKGDRL